MDPNTPTTPPLPPQPPQPAGPVPAPPPVPPAGSPAAPPPGAPGSNLPPRQQAVERIKQGTNILVTVSNNPSVDQLAACIGLTLLLNKAGKHATAVFSGAVPSTIEFLQPEKTIEKNTAYLERRERRRYLLDFTLKTG